MSDLFGNPTIAPKPRPDAFTRSLPSNRPIMKYERPHAAPRTIEIEIRDNARVLCKVDKDGYLEGSRVKRNGGAVAGAATPGRDALLGWGDKAPVRGLATLTPPPKIKGPDTVTRDLTKLGSTLPDYETA